MSANQKIIAFVPAYNVEKTLEKTIEAVPRGSVDEIIVVDDGSRDNTWEVIKKLGVKAVRHQKNRGYGGVQKTGYRESLKNGADIVVMIHGDFQYDPKFTPDVVKPLVSENFDICIGSRMMDHKKALELGLPYWKLIGNIFLTAIENFILGLRLSEYHTGFRAYSRKFLEKVPFERNSENYVFDTEIIVQAKIFGFKIKEVPVERKYFEGAAGINFKKSVEYGFMILWVMFKYLLNKFGIKSFPQFEIEH